MGINNADSAALFNEYQLDKEHLFNNQLVEDQSVEDYSFSERKDANAITVDAAVFSEQKFVERKHALKYLQGKYGKTKHLIQATGERSSSKISLICKNTECKFRIGYYVQYLRPKVQLLTSYLVSSLLCRMKKQNNYY